MEKIVTKLNTLVPNIQATDDLEKNLSKLAVLYNRVSIAIAYLENWKYILGISNDLPRACFEILDMCQTDRRNLGKYANIDFERHELDEDRVEWTLWGKSALVKVIKHYDENPDAQYTLLSDFDGYAVLTEQQVFEWLCETFQ